MWLRARIRAMPRLRGALAQPLGEWQTQCRCRGWMVLDGYPISTSFERRAA
jgi:hypothetical protein